ncbi:hypothetical protein JXB28_02320 [Candidatus Woesearchaeota archaeon]|nr:hypothetical protein [Candidatus Woesearchaeota archaeon]
MADEASYLEIKYGVSDIIGKPGAIAFVLFFWAVIAIYVKIKLLTISGITKYIVSTMFILLGGFIAYMFLGKDTTSCKLKQDGIERRLRSSTMIFWDEIESYVVKDNKVYLKIKYNPNSLMSKAIIKIPLVEHKAKIIQTLDQHIKRKSSDT